MSLFLDEKHPKGISSLRSGHNQKSRPVKNKLNSLGNPKRVMKLRKQVSENQKIYSSDSLFFGYSLCSDS